MNPFDSEKDKQDNEPQSLADIGSWTKAKREADDRPARELYGTALWMLWGSVGGGILGVLFVALGFGFETHGEPTLSQPTMFEGKLYGFTVFMEWRPPSGTTHFYQVNLERSWKNRLTYFNLVSGGILGAVVAGSLRLQHAQARARVQLAEIERTLRTGTPTPIQSP